MKTTDLIKNIEEKGIITEREILLLKRRANNGDIDAANFYPGSEKVIEVTDEQSEKGFKWLYNLYKTPAGKERKNNPFGYREMDILDNYNGERFTFVGFYDDLNRFRSCYIPIYELNGMEYYYNGEIHIVG